LLLLNENQETHSCGDKMTLIIEDIRKAITIDSDNLGFDGELYINLNFAKSALVQLGVEEMNINIDGTTSWPVFNSDVVGELSKQYLVLKIKSIFDATASDTIRTTFKQAIEELEVRIIHEIDEEAADV